MSAHFRIWYRPACVFPPLIEPMNRISSASGSSTTSKNSSCFGVNACRSLSSLLIAVAIRCHRGGRELLDHDRKRLLALGDKCLGRSSVDPIERLTGRLQPGAPIPVVETLLKNAPRLIQDLLDPLALKIGRARFARATTPEERSGVYDMTGVMRERGCAIIFISHNLDEVLRYCRGPEGWSEGMGVGDERCVARRSHCMRP